MKKRRRLQPKHVLAAVLVATALVVGIQAMRGRDDGRQAASLHAGTDAAAAVADGYRLGRKSWNTESQPEPVQPSRNDVDELDATQVQRMQELASRLQGIDIAIGSGK